MSKTAVAYPGLVNSTALSNGALVAVIVVVVVAVVAVALGVGLFFGLKSSPEVSFITVPQGGIGKTSLTENHVLVGNGTDAIDDSKANPTGEFVGDIDAQTVTNKTISNSVISSGATISTVSSAVAVAAGGTGKTSLASGNVLVGNGTSAINDSKVAPSGVFVGDTDTQTLTNKTLSSSVISSLSSPLSVPNGGTGANTFTLGNVLIGNGTSAPTATKPAPTTAFVGTTDTQTLTNKTIASSTLALSSPLSTSRGGTGISSVTNSAIATTNASGVMTFQAFPIPVSLGGTGLGSVTNSRFLSVDGSGNLQTTVAIPSSAVMGTTDTQSVSDKTINTSTISSLSSPIAVGDGGLGVAPTSGNALIGNGTSAVTQSAAPTGEFVGTTDTQTLSNKTITASTVGTLTAPLSIANGGTSVGTLSSGDLIVGSGTSTPTTKTAPSGTIVGISDTQTLTNKTITDATNNVTASAFLSSGGNTTLTSTSSNVLSYGKTLVSTAANTAGLLWSPYTIAYVSTANRTFSTAGTNSIVPTTGVGSLVFPANSLTAGTYILFQFGGSYSAGTTAQTFAPGFVGNTTSSTITSTASGSPGWVLRGAIYIVNSTSYRVYFDLMYNTATARSGGVKNQGGPTTIDLTVDHTFECLMSVTPSTTDPNCTISSCIVRVLPA